MDSVLVDGSVVRLVNVTAHDVVVVRGRLWWGGRLVVVRVAPSGVVARVMRARGASAVLAVGDGVGVQRVWLDGAASVQGVPPPTDGVVIVVSRLVAEVLGPRPDVVFPVGVVRGLFGRVVGCEALGSITGGDGLVSAVNGVV